MTDNEYTWDLPTEIVEELKPDFSYHMIKSETTYIPYRLRKPDTEEKVPLVIYLHGAGERGNDNEKPFEHDAAVEFAKKDWQKKHPCYILIPQCNMEHAWKMEDQIALLKQLVDLVIEENDRIDRSRIYLYGCSMGCMGGLEFVRTYPDYLAGTLMICGGTDPNNLENLLSTPMWFFHAVDDENVYYNRTELDRHGFQGTFLGSRALYEELKRMGKMNVRYTEYPTGMIHEKYGVKAHCAWLPALEEEEVKEWLFECRKKTLPDI